MKPFFLNHAADLNKRLLSTLSATSSRVALFLAVLAPLAGCATPLMKAAVNGQTETVRTILPRGHHNPQHLAWSMCLAASEGHADIVKLLREKGVPVDSECKPPFRSFGIPADRVSSWGGTPLINAARRGQTETAKLLLQGGANVNAVDSRSWTALMWSASEGHAETARILLDNGARSETASKEGLTAMGLAQKGGHADIVGLLEQGPGRSRTGAERVSPAPTEPAPAAPAPVPGTLSKAELQEMMAEVLRGTSPSGDAGKSKHHSDVDKPGYKLAERPDDFAIVIGIEKYSDLPDAQFAERDAESMTDQLIALGFPSRNVIHLAGVKAVRSGLEKYIEDWLPLNVKRDSRIFFYFSGHGAPDVASGSSYLVPFDGDPNFLKRTGYSVKRLYEKLNALRAREIIVVLDACFSGAGGRSVLAKGARPLVTKVTATTVPQKMTVFAAASGDQITSTREDQGHGTFTYHFLKGLSGEAKEATGAVTAKSLFDYLKPKVQDDARRQNREQTPSLQGVQDQEIVRFK